MNKPEDNTTILAAIGRVTVEAETMETLLTEIGDMLLNPKDLWAGKAFTTDIPLNRLIDALIWLYNERKLPDAKKFISILENVFKLAQERNELIHARWIVTAVIPGFPVIPIRTRTGLHHRKGPYYKREHISEKQINDLADRIADASKQLNPFFKAAMKLSGFDV
jgi:hypothetical protein